MRTLFLSMDAVLRPLSLDADYIEAVQWIGQLGTNLAAYRDVQVVLHRVSQDQYSIAAGELMLTAIGKRRLEVAGPKELAGPITTYLYEHEDISDFVVLDNSQAELNGPLHEHVVVCDPSRGVDDQGLVEVKQWLAGAKRARSAALNAALQSSPPPSAEERLRALIPPRGPEHVVAVVAATVPEFELVHLEAPGDLTVSIGQGTPGIDWRELLVGQKVECDVEGEYATRVVRARLLPPDDSVTDQSDNDESSTP